MKLDTLFNESLTDQFSGEDTIKIDPDRDDYRGIVDKLMPTLVRMAYTHLVADKTAHEKRHGPKSDEEFAYNFKFTRHELATRVEKLIESVCSDLQEIGHNDMISYIAQVSKQFKTPLEKE